MMARPAVYADFNNADAGGRLRLNCVGTIQDLARMGLSLRDGLELILQDDELQADGEVHYSEAERIWVASIDWESIRRANA